MKNSGLNRIRPGIVVTRKSYGKDVYFKVEAVAWEHGNQVASLRGLEVRLVADAPVEDLELVEAEELLRYRHSCIEANSLALRKIKSRLEAEGERLVAAVAERPEREGWGERDFFAVPGRVVHLDSDIDYLERCLHAYSQLGLEVNGFNVTEEDQSKVVGDYLRQYKPDILVLTGHDAVLKNKEGSDLGDWSSYRSSSYFARAVRSARDVVPGRDDLVIFAGACQSNFEGLLEAGANFASSPGRVLIHAFDPVYVVQKLAFTSIHETVSLKEIVGLTTSGPEGVGGLETKGRLRVGYPKSPYQKNYLA